MTTLTQLKSLIREHNIMLKGKNYGQLIIEYNSKAKYPVVMKRPLAEVKRSAKSKGVKLTYKDELTGKRRDKSKSQLITDMEEI